MGAAAVANTLPNSAIFLYVAGFFWTIGYDTIYAYQDKEDDETIGVKSTARKFGKDSRTYISILYALAAMLIFIAGYILHPTFIFYIFWGCACLHLIWQIALWDMNDNKDCLQKFRSNRDFGLLVLAGFLFGL
jgi:4-hydroxybenzoate polyprenyltransferase